MEVSNQEATIRFSRRPAVHDVNAIGLIDSLYRRPATHDVNALGRIDSLYRRPATHDVNAIARIDSLYPTFKAAPGIITACI